MAETARRHIVVSDPPREMPFAVQVQTLFGGVMSLMGWIFFGAGLLFTLIFAGNSELMTWVQFRGDKAEAVGTVMEIYETSSSENEVPIKGVRYRFEVATTIHTGESYTKRASCGPGDQVTVEYLVNEPELSRIRGMRARPFGIGVGFVLLFPCVGLGLLIGALRAGFRSRRLLRIGVLGWGRLVSKKATGARVNKQPVYKLTFRFTDPRAALPGGPYRGDGGGEQGRAGFKGWAQTYDVVCATHEVQRVTDEEEEPLLFDPDRPERAVMLDGLPGRTDFDGSGDLTTTKSPWPTLLAPALGFFGLLIALLFLLT